MKANLTHCPAVHVYMHERGLWPAKKPLGIMLCMTLPVSGWWPFLALPSPRAAVGLLCEGGCSPSQRPHADQTSDHHAPSRDIAAQYPVGRGMLLNPLVQRRQANAQIR
jgi:hypothetical protein